MCDGKGLAVSGLSDQRGSASPLVVAMIAVVMVLAAAASQAGAGLVADARASGAADLAALGAAQADRDLRAQGVSAAASLERACAEAEALSRRNGAILTRCARGNGRSIVVSVEVSIRGALRPASTSARAGPAWD